MDKIEYIIEKGGFITVLVNVLIYEEDDYYYAYSPALRLTAEGEDLDDAMKSFDESIIHYLEHVLENKTLEADLKEHGWHKNKWAKKRYIPSQYNERQVMSNMGVIDYQSVNRSVEVPVYA